VGAKLRIMTSRDTRSPLCAAVQPNLTLRRRSGKRAILLYLFSLRIRKCGLLYFASLCPLRRRFDPLFDSFCIDDTPICFSKSLETLSWNADRGHVCCTSVSAAKSFSILHFIEISVISIWIWLYYLLFHVNKTYYNITTQQRLIV